MHFINCKRSIPITTAVYFALTLCCIAGQIAAQNGGRTFVELPAEVKLPPAAARGQDWTQAAIVIQPWAKSQWDIMAEENIDGMPQRLAEQFGLNTLVVNPSQPHFYFVNGDERYALTEIEIKNAIAVYRKAGFRIILYSSIVNLGHSKPWQTGILAKEHPEWSQLDANGKIIHTYGNPWLSPTTGAMDRAIEYTRQLIEIYQPDAVMLDNSGFHYSTEGGFTGYSKGSEEQFRQYVVQRFGGQCKQFFGVSAEQISIPKSPGPLYNLWLNWRNICWAQSMKRFHEEVSPTVLFANTQFLFDTAVLATDMQPQQLDLIFSESRQLSSQSVSLKMMLGRGIGMKRPLWNYMGTFDEKDSQLLRPPGEVARITAATFAHDALPWLVYYGFDGRDAENEPSRKVLRDMFDFRAAHPDFYGLQPLGTIAAISSSRGRMFEKASLITPAMQALQIYQTPGHVIYDVNLPYDQLDRYELIFAIGAKSLSAAEAKTLRDWVVRGGTLIAEPTTGTLDDIGRERGYSALGTPNSQLAKGVKTIGRGRIITGSGEIWTVLNDPPVKAAIERLDQTIKIEGDAAKDRLVEVCPYAAANGGTILHIVNHGEDIGGEWQLVVPRSLALKVKSATFHHPGDAAAVAIRSLKREPKGLRLTLPPMGAYAVVELK